MDDDSLLQLLLDIMEKLSVKVVRKNLKDEEFTISGGSCRVHGHDMVILDKRTSLSEQIFLLSRELARHNLDDLFVPPVVRELINGDKDQITDKPQV